MPRRPPSLRDRLARDLADLEGQIQALLDISEIRYINPNRRDADFVVIGAADYGWAPSDDQQQLARMIVSDAWQGYSGIEPEVYDHQSVSQAAQKRAGGSPSAVPGVDRVTSNLKTWLRGTHHGVGADHLDAYLDEFVFRFNRRYYPMAGFATLLGLGAVQPP